MNWADIINAVFELGIGLLAIPNVLAIRRDKSIRGVFWGLTLWATIWGYWNLFYYPHLNQWFSFSCGILIALMNSLWILHALYYHRMNRNNK